MRPQADFIEAVMARLDLTKTQLGVALKKPNAYQIVHAWIKGRAKLGYEDTMAMLEMCGWVNENGVEAPGPDQVTAALDEVLGELRKISSAFETRPMVVGGLVAQLDQLLAMSDATASGVKVLAEGQKNQIGQLRAEIAEQRAETAEQIAEVHRQLALLAQAADSPPPGEVQPGG